MATTTKNKNALTITRIFDAPRDLVWKAWTDPEYYKKWWGPTYFTAPISKIDLRVGGKYLSCMRGPDGKDYWSTGVYREIVPLERLVIPTVSQMRKETWSLPRTTEWPETSRWSCGNNYSRRCRRQDENDPEA